MQLNGSHNSGGSNPQSNLNTFTGGFVLRSGNVLLNTPSALGGYASGTPTTLELQGGNLQLFAGGVGPGLATIIGNPNTIGLSVIVNGTSTSIVTDNNGGIGGTGFLDQYFQFGNLTVGNTVFTSTPSTDSQNIRFAGTVTGGNAAVFNVTTAAALAGRSVVELSGVIQDTGSVAFAINKTGTGTVRITGTANTYTGGTNIFTGGAVQVTGTTGTPMGTGMVIVNPGGYLRIAASSSTTGAAGVNILSSTAGFGALVLDGDFSPTNGTGALTATTQNDAFGGTVQIGIPTFTTALDMTQIGDGNQFLGAYGASLGTAGVQYLASSLTAGNGSRYRLGANSASNVALTFAGSDNVLSGANSVEIGSSIPTVTLGLVAPLNSTGTVVIQNSNSYSAGTLINRGSTLVVETGGAPGPGGATPLGSGVVEIRNSGVLIFRGGDGSAYNVPALGNANTYVLRNLGVIRLDNNSGVFAGSGTQGRWADATGVTLDGGTFNLVGTNNQDTYEKIGAVTVGLNNGTIQLSRQNSGTNVLEVSDIVRGSQKGTLTVTSAAAATIAAGVMTAQGSLNGAAAFDRLLVTTPTFGANAGTTNNGAGATGGIAPVWMVDGTNLTFLSNQGGTLGLQPLLSIATPGAGQVAYSNRLTTANTFTGLTTGVATVDIVGVTQALTASQSVYALRTDSAITTGNAATVTGASTQGSNIITGVSGANIATLRVGQPITGTGIPAGAVITALGASTITMSNQASLTQGSVTLTPSHVLTIVSGGLIVTNGSGAKTFTTPIATAGELVIYNPNTASTTNFTGPITATGITKFGAGDMRLDADNRGTLTGDVTVSGLNWFRLNNQYALGGSTVNPYINGNQIILNGGQMYSEGQARYLSTVVVNADSNVGGNSSYYNQLTVNPYANNTFNTPVVVRVTNNAFVNYGSATFNGPVSINTETATNSNMTILGGVSGVGALQKWGLGTLSIGGDSPAYSAAVTVNQGALVSLNGLAQTPFGTGTITVSPGAAIGISNAANVGGGLTINSDQAGAGVLNMQYVGALPAVTFVSSDPTYDGVVAIDVTGFSTALNQATLTTNGNSFLGGGLSNQALSAYTATTLGVGAGNTYRIGGGGGSFSINSPVLTGTASVQFGVVSNTIQAQSVAVTLGGGTVLLNTPNSFTGGSTINLGQLVELGNSGALGTGTITFNGGTLRANGNLGLPRLAPNITLANDVTFLGDAIIDTNGVNIFLAGNVSLSSSAFGTAQGSARTITVNNVNARAIITGNITDGVGTSFNSLIKTGTERARPARHEYLHRLHADQPGHARGGHGGRAPRDLPHHAERRFARRVGFRLHADQ